MEHKTNSTVVDALNQAVADTAVTTMLAQNFHWNVTGMAFGPLHALFQEIYEDHFVAQDDLAERIKSLGGHADGTMAGMLARTNISEHDGTAPADVMVQKMQTAQETLSHTLRAAADNGDTLTEDLAISRGRVHDKFAWMLRAHLQ